MPLISMFNFTYREHRRTVPLCFVEGPCCLGLYQIARQAADSAERKIPLRKTVVGIRGNIVAEG